MNVLVDFIKKHTAVLLYSLLGLITAVAAIILIIWAVSGDKERLIDNYPASLVADAESSDTETVAGSLQTEYLVGQKFKSDGLTLNIGTDEKPKLISIDQCSINYDFSSAGEKTVEVTYNTDEYTVYRAEIRVNVIFVRSMEVEVYPSKIDVSNEGAVTTDEKFTMYATLAEKPRTDAFGSVTKTSYGYRIKLDESMYTVSCSADSQLDNFYNVSFYCGTVSSSFSFYNAAGRSFIVSSSNDVVPFTEQNTAAGNAELTLIVTQRDESYQIGCTGKTKGFYVYANGSEEKLYEFNYELKDKSENLLSKEISESVQGGLYIAEVDGRTFSADAAVWQNAVVRGMIIDDNGFKLVVNSEKRILSFNCESETADGENVPSLTLYVTDYDMNPLLGTGNGYSRGVYIFTDSDGNSYKINFYMGIWVWTFVPLSGTNSDVFSDVSVNDYVYNEEAGEWNSYLRGTLYTNITLYQRGSGSKTITFTADETLWLGALAGM